MTAGSEGASLRIYVMVGIPASGKTTWIKGNLPASVARIRLDKVRSSIYGHYPLHLEESKEDVVWERAERLLAEALQEGHDTVVDSMALTREWRQRIVGVATRSTTGPIRKIAVFLDTPVEIALERNRTREKQVLEEVIREMFGHLQRPAADEGFNQIVVVRPMN